VAQTAFADESDDSAPAAQAPVVEVANPEPGAYLRRGNFWISGVACDPNAPMTDFSAGIARIAVFLGDRDTTEGVQPNRPGGFTGGATAYTSNPNFDDYRSGLSSRMGLRNPDVSTCPQPLAGWRILIPQVKKGTYNMNIYVMGKNGLETDVLIPIRVDMP
jgi:hypothetical protein